MKHKCSVVILLSLTISRARKSRNRGDFTTGRCWIIRADGTEIWNQISASQATEPITNDNKSVVACCVCYLFIYLFIATDSNQDFWINPTLDLDSLLCRCQSLCRVSWKLFVGCARNANKYPKILDFAIAREVEKWSGIRIWDLITTKS